MNLTPSGCSRCLRSCIGEICQSLLQITKGFVGKSISLAFKFDSVTLLLHTSQCTSETRVCAFSATIANAVSKVKSMRFSNRRVMLRSSVRLLDVIPVQSKKQQSHFNYPNVCSYSVSPQKTRHATFVVTSAV